MKHFNQVVLAVSLLLLAFSSAAQQYSKVTYVHSDPDGTAFVATNEAGDLEWQIEHYPFGDEYENTQTERNSDIGFTGKPFDEEIGLSYMGGRWYDPDIGRFTGIDPMPVQFEDYESFNRYAYAKNNPYKYVDPDGNFVFLAPLAIFVAKEIAAEVASRATGGATDFLSTRRLATKIIEGGVKLFRRKAATPSSVTGTGGTSGAAQLQKNKENGAAFEQKVKVQLEASQTGVVEQVTIKTKSGVRTRIDLLGRDAGGAIRCTECKASATAPLTKNQKLGFPEIQQSGGTVVGNGKPGFLGGTKIPATKVDIVRP